MHRTLFRAYFFCVVLSLLGGICLFYIIFEGRLLIFYRNILKNCFKFNCQVHWNLLDRCVLLLDAVSQVFFFFFLSLLIVFSPSSFPTFPGLTHWLLFPQIQPTSSSQANPNLRHWYWMSSFRWFGTQSSSLIPGSSLFPAWLLHGVPMMKAQSLFFFFYTSSSLGFFSWILQDCW